MDQTSLILSDRLANQSNQIQTHSQMCHRSTGHSYCTQTCEFYSTEQQNLTATKVSFLQNDFFPLLYTSRFNRNPIENDDCTFL